jgi:hypothetical protein
MRHENNISPAHLDTTKDEEDDLFLAKRMRDA